MDAMSGLGMANPKTWLSEFIRESELVSKKFRYKFSRSGDVNFVM